MLAHHAEPLEKLQADHDSLDSVEEVDLTRRRHLNILMGFIQDRVQPKYTAAQKRLALKNPTVTFEDVWYLLRPGEMAYAKFKECWFGCQIASVKRKKAVSYEDEGNTIIRVPEHWAVKAWFLQSGWHTSSMRCVTMEVQINIFEGEHAVTDLLVFLREYHDQHDAGKRRAHFEQRGEKMRDIVWAGHSYMFHEGQSANQIPTVACYNVNKSTPFLPLCNAL